MPRAAALVNMGASLLLLGQRGVKEVIEHSEVSLGCEIGEIE